MRIIYEAYDGRKFNNEDDCEIYESALRHPHLFSLTFYNKNGDSYGIPHHNIFADYIYNECEKIDIHTKEEFNDLKWLREATGWSEWEDITDFGVWIRKDLEFGNIKWEKVGGKE